MCLLDWFLLEAEGNNHLLFTLCRTKFVGLIICLLHFVGPSLLSLWSLSASHFPCLNLTCPLPGFVSRRNLPFEIPGNVVLTKKKTYSKLIFQVRCEYFPFVFQPQLTKHGFPDCTFISGTINTSLCFGWRKWLGRLCTWNGADLQKVLFYQERAFSFPAVFLSHGLESTFPKFVISPYGISNDLYIVIFLINVRGKLIYLSFRESIIIILTYILDTGKQFVYNGLLSILNLFCAYLHTTTTITIRNNSGFQQHCSHLTADTLLKQGGHSMQALQDGFSDLY